MPAMKEKPFASQSTGEFEGAPSKGTGIRKARLPGVGTKGMTRDWTTGSLKKKRKKIV